MEPRPYWNTILLKSKYEESLSVPVLDSLNFKFSVIFRDSRTSLTSKLKLQSDFSWLNEIVISDTNIVYVVWSQQNIFIQLILVIKYLCYVLQNCFEDNLIDPVIILRNVREDWKKSEIASFSSHALDIINNFKIAGWNDSNNFPQVINLQDHAAARVA
jgi:hypothetical protein